MTLTLFVLPPHHWRIINNGILNHKTCEISSAIIQDWEKILGQARV